MINSDRMTIISRSSCILGAVLRKYRSHKQWHNDYNFILCLTIVLQASNHKNSSTLGPTWSIIKNVFVVIFGTLIRTSTFHQKLNKFHSGSVFSKHEVFLFWNLFTKNLTELGWLIASYGPEVHRHTENSKMYVWYFQCWACTVQLVDNTFWRLQKCVQKKYCILWCVKKLEMSE
jgi:hypothetical protein